MEFSYDPAGTILSITHAINPGRSQGFTYDVANRLTSADGVYVTRNYSYDALGNRLSRTANGQADSYIYSVDSNRLDSVSGVNAQSFGYDPAGNTIAKRALGFS